MDKIVCTVSRSKWARGGKLGGPALLNNQGNMCCLGFLGKTCAVSEDYLSGKLMPQSLSSLEWQKYPTGDDEDGINWDLFAHINDDEKILDDEREHKLMKLAEDNGFTFIFED